MSRVIQTIQALPNLLPLKSVSEEMISEAENLLGLRFAEDYRLYVGTFGAILADGIELTGIAKSKNRYVVFVTKQEWELNSEVSRKLYVIENVGIDGIIIWQNEHGRIFRTTPHNAPVEIAASLADYIDLKRK